jgi:1-acyl-sn-glycerol-3-phosphate acyltransferase
MVFRQITDELMYEIRELTGQDYVDTYATKPAAPAAPVETLETTASPEMPERRSSASVLSAAAL